MRRVALTLRADAVEAVLDRLMPLLPWGVYERPLDPERTEVAFFGDGLPAAAELDALAGDALLGREEEDVPDSREERRRRAGRAWTVAGRLLAALVAGEDPPDLAPERRDRALAGLVRDGLVVRDAGGEPRLP